MRQAATGPDATTVDARTQIHLSLLRGLHLSLSDGHVELREAGMEGEGPGNSIIMMIFVELLEAGMEGERPGNSIIMMIFVELREAGMEGERPGNSI